VHDIKLQQTHNESAQMLGAGTVMVHHRNLAVNTYVKQLNNEKRIAKTVRLQNGQLLLIVGLHMQMQSQSKKEIKLLKTIIEGIR